MRADNPLVQLGGRALAREPLRTVKGLVSAHIAYPVAEWAEKRSIRPERADLRRHYKKPWTARRADALARLADMLAFAGGEVPYYRDLFAERGFDPEKVRQDPRYLEELPVLTKEIITEQGPRLLSRPTGEVRHHACRTGGSTGMTCIVFFDQPAADRASAVTLFARERIGKRQSDPETHFACRFPDLAVPSWPSREDFKSFGMNRSNIFFDRLDAKGLEEIWQTLRRQRPRLVHAHPSTVYALACHVERTHGPTRLFDVFESSGELLEPHMRQRIADVFRCRVVDRYGLAELGVVAYELDGEAAGMRVLESEAWPEIRPADHPAGASELVFTGLRNALMPLVRYATGDLGTVRETDTGFVIENMVGRMHDIVPINGIDHATHHVQDVLDHRVRGVRDFQIDLRHDTPVLRIVLEQEDKADAVRDKVEEVWPGAFAVEFVGADDLVRVGERAKFRHVVTA
jgi:phenylacetate-CoA ligase